MNPADFDYELPPHLIAQFPPARRRDARLLIVGAGGDALRDAHVPAMTSLIEPDDLVVLNDTRVIPARLFGRKDTGGAVEVLIERMLDGVCALAQVRASKAPRAGTRIAIEPDGEIRVAARDGDFFRIEASGGETLTNILERCGHVPLPPYVDRADETLDAERYQTVYADKPGAVAAPTAGLHLDETLLGEIEAAGARIARLTLHVGAGTFQPVRVDDLDDHVMHAERIDVPAALCEAIAATRAAGGRVVAIGTTVVRALESAAASGRGLEAFAGETRLFIRPGYRFRVVDALLTNFHLPRSTLLMLVCAFGGFEAVMSAYRHAVGAGYRFFSYGDAMWLSRQTTGGEAGG